MGSDKKYTVDNLPSIFSSNVSKKVLNRCINKSQSSFYNLYNKSFSEQIRRTISDHYAAENYVMIDGPTENQYVKQIYARDKEKVKALPVGQENKFWYEDPQVKALSRWIYYGHNQDLSGKDNWYIYDPQENKSRMKWIRDTEIPQPISAEQAYKRSVKSADRIVVPFHRDPKEDEIWKNTIRSQYNENTGLVDFDFASEVYVPSKKTVPIVGTVKRVPDEEVDKILNGNRRRNVLPKMKRAHSVALEKSQTHRMEPQKPDQALAEARQIIEAKIGDISKDIGEEIPNASTGRMEAQKRDESIATVQAKKEEEFSYLSGAWAKIKRTFSPRRPLNPGVRVSWDPSIQASQQNNAAKISRIADDSEEEDVLQSGLT